MSSSVRPGKARNFSPKEQVNLSKIIFKNPILGKMKTSFPEEGLRRGCQEDLAGGSTTNDADISSARGGNHRIAQVSVGKQHAGVVPQGKKTP